MDCRFARDAEIPDAARLVAHSFTGSGRTKSWWEDYLGDPVFGGGPETLLVGEDGGRLVAACQIHPLRQWIAGTAVPVTGVGTVAVSPTHRKRRLAADLIRKALHAGIERGDVGSALYPFRVAFYHRLGYGLAGEAIQYQVPPRTLRDSAERHRVDLLDDDSARQDAFRLYETWAGQQTGQLERTQRMWSRLFHVQDHALVGYRTDSGELEGYAFVLYRADLPSPGRFLEVDEMVWTSDAARRGLYGWLGSLDDQWPFVLVRALPSQRFRDWLSEPVLPHGSAPMWRLWAPSATLMMGPMFRILDVKKAFEGRRIKQAPTLAVSIVVTDVDIAANNATWRVALDAGRAAVERSGAVDAVLRLDVSTLSRIFVGALSPSAALSAGLVECDRPELLAVLDAALALPEPWTFDRF